jgi:zinc transporter ZupT
LCAFSQPSLTISIKGDIRIKNPTAIVIILICIATFISTLLGGLFALRTKGKLSLLLGFSAGAVIGVAILDLLPTAIELSKQVYNIRKITSIVALGFMIYFLMDRSLLWFNQINTNLKKITGLKGKVGAACLTLHSFIDGTAIGLAFRISPAIGSMVAIAVLVHDFSDGINTTNVILKENGNKKTAMKWLVINAVAPILGACSTYYYELPKEHLGVLFALVSGFFLYIGASDFLPASQQRSPKISTTLMTILGLLIIFLVTRITEP